MNTKKMSFQITTAIMDIFTACMIDPEAAGTQEEKEKMKNQVYKLLSEASNNIEFAMQEAIKAKSQIIMPDSYKKDIDKN